MKYDIDCGGKSSLKSIIITGRRLSISSTKLSGTFAVGAVGDNNCCCCWIGIESYSDDDTLGSTLDNVEVAAVVNTSDSTAVVGAVVVAVVLAVVAAEVTAVEAAPEFDAVDVFLSAYSMHVHRPLLCGADVSILTTLKRSRGPCTGPWPGVDAPECPSTNPNSEMGYIVAVISPGIEP